MAFDFFDGTPTGVQHGAVSVAKGTWGAMQPVLRESILGPVPGDYSTLLLVNWATAYPVFWRKGESLPQPYTWLRARYLYAVYPADVTTFNKMKNPLYLLIMGLKLYSSLTGVPIFILQWFFIDKKDEFQVVNFILSFKAYQFLSGVYTAASLAETLFFCLGSPGYLTGEPGACNALLPTSSPKFPYVIAMELPRILLIATSVMLLVYRYGYGGIGELKALAEVRVDVADGSLDGFADTKKLEHSKKHSTHITHKDLEDAKEAARIRFEAEEGEGGYLPHIMAVDFCILGIEILFWVWSYFSLMAASTKETEHDRLLVLYNTLYYIKLSYALSSFPFLIFLAPIIGAALYCAYPTAYDKTGLLVPKLSASKIMTKNKMARRRAELERRLEEDDSYWGTVRASWHKSNARRWARVGTRSICLGYDLL